MPGHWRWFLETSTQTLWSQLCFQAWGKPSWIRSLRMHQVRAETINKPATPTSAKELDWMLPFRTRWSQSPCCLSRLQGQRQLCPGAGEDSLQQQRWPQWLRAVWPAGTACSLIPVPSSLFPGPGQQSHAVHRQLAEKTNCREQFSLPIQPIFAKARWGASKQNDSAQTQQSQAEQGLGVCSEALWQSCPEVLGQGFSHCSAA